MDIALLWKNFFEEFHQFSHILNKKNVLFTDSSKLFLNDEQQKNLTLVLENLTKRYEHYRDPWGFDLETVFSTFKLMLPLYLHYFNVRVFGIENIPKNNFFMIPNHSGQIPIDGALITTALAWNCPENPRVLHSMVDRFVMNLPFIADFYGKTGAILGDRENCSYLLEKNESILAFPEGVRGVSKNTKDFYKLQKFSDGFYRIALSKNVPIVPVAVIGAEEMFPLVWHTKTLQKTLARSFKIPTIPLSANYFPLPSPVDLYFLPPVETNSQLSPDSPDKLIHHEVEKISQMIQEKIHEGRRNQRSFRDQLKYWQAILS